jgi:hypothetical protein
MSGIACVVIMRRESLLSIASEVVKEKPDLGRKMEERTVIATTPERI